MMSLDQFRKLPENVTCCVQRLFWGNESLQINLYEGWRGSLTDQYVGEGQLKIKLMYVFNVSVEFCCSNVLIGRLALNHYE